MDRILFNQPYRKNMLANYDKLIDRMGNPGVSDRVAMRMLELLQ